MKKVCVFVRSKACLDRYLKESFKGCYHYMDQVGMSLISSFIKVGVGYLALNWA